MVKKNVIVLVLMALISISIVVADVIISTCGDGVVDVGEACDDANSVDGDGCSASCTKEIGYSCIEEWSSISSGLPSGMNKIYFVDENVGFAVGSLGAIFKTTDGGRTWVSQTSGTTGYLSDVFFLDSQKGWIAGMNGNLLLTSDGGKSWTLKQIGTNTDVFKGIFFSDANNGWVVGYYGSVYKTTNGGTTWTKVSGLLSTIYLDVYFTDVNHGWIVGGNGYVLRTTNAGATWTPTWLSVRVQSSTTGMWSTINPQLNNVFFIDSNNGWIAALYGYVFKTTDGGLNWRPINTKASLPLTGLGFYDLNNGWVSGYSNTLLKTTDGGITWNQKKGATVGNIYDIFLRDTRHIWSLASSVSAGSTVLNKGKSVCERLVEICTDKIDNDGDALVDCADIDCQDESVCALDTDGDGTPDATDVDDDNDGVCDVGGITPTASCSAGPDSSSLDPKVCSDRDLDRCDDCSVQVDGFGPLSDFNPARDGTDTDGDGRCDLSDTETCDDTFDNDGDALVDCADTDCFVSGGVCSEVCTGGLDEDGDTTVDCLDSDCSATSVCDACAGVSCEENQVCSSGSCVCASGYHDESGFCVVNKQCLPVVGATLCEGADVGLTEDKPMVVLSTFVCPSPVTAGSCHSVCDDGNNFIVNSESSPYSCKCRDGYILDNGVCNVNLCANSQLDAGEECYDGNLNSGDGCSSACQLEQNYIWTGSGVKSADVDGTFGFTIEDVKKAILHLFTYSPPGSSGGYTYDSATDYDNDGDNDLIDVVKMIRGMKQ